MSAYLLDVSVLLALAWPRHKSHPVVQRWFAAHAHQGWATCPLTQAGFVRIISNPALSPDALQLKQAISLLQLNLEHPTHHFWPDSLGLPDALAKVAEVTGHRQITDAYLLALCVARKGSLVTLDRSIAQLAKDIRGEPVVTLG